MKNRINLIPRELQPRIHVPKEAIPVALFVAFVVYAAMSAASLQIRVSSRKAELARVQTENKARREKLDALNSQQVSVDKESEKLKSLQSVLNHKSFWSDVFKELSSLTPKDVWLTTMGSSGDAANRTLLLRGEAISQKKVADFFAMLEKSQHFGKAVIKFSELDAKTRPELFKFELTVPFQYPSSGGDI